MKKIREQSTQTVDNPIMRETSLEGSSREPFGASADSAESVDLIKSHEDLQLSHDVDRGKVGESIKKNIPMSSSALLKVDVSQKKYP